VTILLRGDIETNPGLYTIIKSLQGSFHQEDLRLGTNTGTRFLGLFFSVIKSISFIGTLLISILYCEGTKLYRSLGNTLISISE